MTAATDKTILRSNRYPAGQPAAGGGFTLVEMLIVLGIIALLMGLMFPVFGVLRNRAWDARTRNTAVQVANAWDGHLQAFRAYPVTTISSLPEAKIDSGDYMFPMTRDALNLLNWYGYKHRDFAGTGATSVRKSEAQLDKEWYDLVRVQYLAARDYNLTRPDSVSVKLSNSQTESGKSFSVTVKLLERFFERNEVQWRDGLKGEKDGRMIWVKLDTNYDGMISWESKDAAGRPVTETIRKSAIAWAEDPTGKRAIIKSW